MKKIFHYIPLFLLTLAALVTSCSDTIEDAVPSTPAYTGLALTVPKASPFSSSLSMNATDEERTAQNMYLLCYPQTVDGQVQGEPYAAELTNFGDNDINNDAATYTIVLQPGTYHVYVVANVGDKVVQTVDKKVVPISETDLQALTLSYGTAEASSLPTAGSIPMVYSSTADDNFTNTGGNVAVYNGKATEVAANLTFTCAKVVLNVIFDPDNERADIIKQQQKAKTVFSGINWLLTGVTGNHITSSTNLLTAPTSSTDGALSMTLPTGSFYNDYTYTAGNEGVTNANVVEPSGDAVASGTSPNARKWLYRATYYLPECSVTEADKATSLTVAGNIIHNSTETANSYDNITGAALTKGSDNSYKLKRGHYYEIVSFVNGLGKFDLPTTVNVEDWTPVQISADFLHTTLWVSKTQVGDESNPVTSLDTGTLTYETNALSITTGCDTKVSVDGEDKDVITAKQGETTSDGVTTKTLTLTVNPDIPFSAFTDTNNKGKAKFWIQAGNIKKYIDVYYSAEPFLTVTPQQEVIYWTNDAKEASTLTKTLTFKTNLGGIKFQSSDFYTFNGTATGGVLSYGSNSNSKVLVNCTSNKGATGTITVKATEDPVTTTEHTFTVLPLTSGYDVAKEVKVTVKPVAGDYRIYMRAINDLQLMKSDNGGERVFSQGYIGDMEKWWRKENNTPGLDNNGNWLDGWTYQSSNPANYEEQTTTNWSDKANAYYHCAYIYTQIGETETASDKDKIPAWLFTTAEWPGDGMTADANNPGWYYINEKIGKESTHNIAGSTGTKIIKPGETLIIFNDRSNTTKGYTLHRFTHHLDPGIPLFNFEDHEGWYLYDPTCDPYYRVFDDKPKVEDITYEIYTKEVVTGWYHIYGVATNVTTNTITDPANQSFTIYSNSTNSEKQANGWYKTTLKFKCAHGYYEKELTLKLGDKDGSKGKPLLFEKMPLKPTNNTITGYYDGSSWHEGEPTSSAKRRR